MTQGARARTNRDCSRPEEWELLIWQQIRKFSHFKLRSILQRMVLKQFVGYKTNPPDRDTAIIRNRNIALMQKELDRRIELGLINLENDKYRPELTTPLEKRKPRPT